MGFPRRVRGRVEFLFEMFRDSLEFGVWSFDLGGCCKEGDLFEFCSLM